MDGNGKVQDKLKQALKEDSLALPEIFQLQQAQVRDILRKLAGKLEIKNADERRTITTRQAVLDSERFKALWDRIKHKTTYRQDDLEKLAGLMSGTPIRSAVFIEAAALLKLVNDSIRDRRQFRLESIDRLLFGNKILAG